MGVKKTSSAEILQKFTSGDETLSGAVALDTAQEVRAWDEASVWVKCRKNTEERYSERLKEIQRQREGAKEVKKGVHRCGGGSEAEEGSPFYLFIYFWTNGGEIRVKERNMGRGWRVNMI